MLAGDLGIAGIVAKHRLALARQRLEQRLKALALQVLAPQRIERIDDGLASIHRRVHIEHHIAGDTPVLVIITTHIKDTGHGELHRSLGNLEAILPRLVGASARRRKLVDAAERRLIVCARELGAHAPRGHLGTLIADGLDRMLIQLVGPADAAIGKPRLVKFATRHLGKPS